MGMSCLTGCANEVNLQSSELYDTGIISVRVPEGWQGYHGADFFNEYDEKGNPNTIHVGKGAKEELELFSSPRIDINFKDTLFSTFELDIMKKAYDNVEDIDPITLDNFTWSGYKASSMDYPYIFLFADDGVNALHVAILLKNNDKSIAIDDQDVLYILESIKINNFKKE